MEHRDFHWHWWHWLLIILAIMLTVGVTYTLVNNYEIVKKDDKGFVRGIEQTVEHPIDTTKNTVKDLTN
ncbi:MAG: hypothetical protein IJE43_14925 [Alphaproteobacteria bacterium]|nr:hypothetical protein [Alphaproteobacteria bacterium]